MAAGVSLEPEVDKLQFLGAVHAKCCCPLGADAVMPQQLSLSGTARRTPTVSYTQETITEGALEVSYKGKLSEALIYIGCMSC
jgi:hypothetical protein